MTLVVNLKVTLAVNLKVTLEVNSMHCLWPLAVNLAVLDFGSKVKGDSGSKL